MSAPGPGHVLAIVAHPDDESFGCGSVIAHAVAQGHRVSVCCATLGERGELAEGYRLGDRSLADVRHDELRAAAAVLGAECLAPLGLRDSGWDGPAGRGSLCAASEEELAGTLAAVIAAQRPDVVLTLVGDDGHRDHLRLAGAVRAAFGSAAGAGASLYQWCLPNHLMRQWAEQMARLRPDTAHLALEIAALGTPPEQCTTIIDTSAHLPARRAAIAAHASQTSPYAGLAPELAAAFLTTDHLVRVAPPHDGAAVETQLTWGHCRVA